MRSTARCDQRMVSLNALPADIVERPVSNTAHRIVARAGLFQKADPAEIADVSKQLHRVHFTRRQTIYAEGESGDHLYVIASGKIKLGRLGVDGRLHLLTVLGAPEMFGALSVFDPGPRTSTATALTDMTAVAIGSDVLRGWVAHHPDNRRATATCAGPPAAARRSRHVRPDLR